MSSLDRCVVCDGTDLRPITEIAATPVFSNVLFPTRDAARAADVGDITLAVCEQCSHLQNVTFDEQRLAYSPDYENSLHFSPTFQAYATELARDLVSVDPRHDFGELARIEHQLGSRGRRLW